MDFVQKSAFDLRLSTCVCPPSILIQNFADDSSLHSSYWSSKSISAASSRVFLANPHSEDIAFYVLANKKKRYIRQHYYPDNTLTRSSWFSLVSQKKTNWYTHVSHLAENASQNVSCLAQSTSSHQISLLSIGQIQLSNALHMKCHIYFQKLCCGISIFLQNLLLFLG